MPRLCLLIQVKQHSQNYFISSIFFWVQWHRSNLKDFLMKIWSEQELNPWPIGHELSLLTTRPPTWPVFFSYYSGFPWATKRTNNRFNLLCQRNPLCIFLLCISNVTLKFPLSIFDQFFSSVERVAAEPLKGFSSTSCGQSKVLAGTLEESWWSELVCVCVRTRPMHVQVSVCVFACAWQSEREWEHEVRVMICKFSHWASRGIPFH